MAPNDRCGGDRAGAKRHDALWATPQEHDACPAVVRSASKRSKMVANEAQRVNRTATDRPTILRGRPPGVTRVIVIALFLSVDRIDDGGGLLTRVADNLHPKYRASDRAYRTHTWDEKSRVRDENLNTELGSLNRWFVRGALVRTGRGTT